MSEYASMTNLVITIVTILITVLGAQLSSFINVKINSVKQKVNNEKVDKYTNLALDTINKVVIALNQTTVNELKKAAADGKISKSEIFNLTQTATNTVLNTLSSEVVEYLTMAYGDVQKWIHLHIENSVVTVKKVNSNNNKVGFNK